MARIAGITLPQDKPVHIGLTAIYGIGHSAAGKILAEAKVDPCLRVRDMTEAQVNEVRTIVEKRHRVEGDLRRENVRLPQGRRKPSPAGVGFRRVAGQYGRP